MDRSRVVTRSRDLRTGTSPWRGQGRHELEKVPLPRRVQWDVVVVGAGISGALIADALLAEGLQVLMLDRRGVARGSTPASTALLQHELDVPLMDLARRLGAVRAMRAWQRSRLALEALKARIATGPLRASVVARDSLYLSGTLLDEDGLAKEQSWRSRAGIASTLLGAPEVRRRYGIRGRAALLSHGQLEANPLQLTLSLLQSATQRGLRIATPVQVTAIECDARQVWLSTDHGAQVRAAHVVFATGYETLASLPSSRQRVHSTWAIATRPQPERLWPTRCLMWEAADPYLYLRSDPQGRVICGGEDESVDDAEHRDRLLPAKVKSLSRKLHQLLPQLDSRPQFAWTGAFGVSSTGLPTIGALPGRPRCHVALGYGGNGITFSMLAAQLLCNAILGRLDPDADLFAVQGRRMP
jgi:glycine/D-amino acid oxidase-like deaminating enzyme